MSDIAGTISIVLILVIITTLAVRSLWKSHKNGGHCSGDCGSCHGCNSNGTHLDSSK